MLQAVRIKMREVSFVCLEPSGSDAERANQIKSALETHFRNIHSVQEYADLLLIPAKTLSRICKKAFGKTPTELIADRIGTEARRELYLTDRSVKEIGLDLGFEDAYYFSRFFKKVSGVAPEIYRQGVRN